MSQLVPHYAPVVQLADVAALANKACTTVVEEGLNFFPGKLDRVPSRAPLPAQVGITVFRLASGVGSVYLADIICNRGAGGVVSAYAFFKSKLGKGKQEAGIIKIPVVKPAGARLGYTVSPLGLRSPSFKELETSLSLNAAGDKSLSSRMYPWRRSLTRSEQLLLDNLESQTAAPKQRSSITYDPDLYKALFSNKIHRISPP
jgi:hypothetical protein